MIKIMSFGFKSGDVPNPPAQVIDVRRMRNPYYDPILRPIDGRDAKVQNFVRHDPRFHELRTTAISMLDDGDAIAFGCMGGRHRSVAMAEIVAAQLREEGHEVEVIHRELVAA